MNNIRYIVIQMIANKKVRLESCSVADCKEQNEHVFTEINGFFWIRHFCCKPSCKISWLFVKNQTHCNKASKTLTLDVRYLQCLSLDGRKIQITPCPIKNFGSISYFRFEKKIKSLTSHVDIV